MMQLSIYLENMTMENDFIKCKLLLDGARGVSIPKDFASLLDVSMVVNLSDNLIECLDILKQGYEQESYWDAWDDVLADMELKLDDSDDIYRLWQDGDLFAVIYI